MSRLFLSEILRTETAGQVFSEVVSLLREERGVMLSLVEQQRASMQTMLQHERSEKELLVRDSQSTGQVQLWSQAVAALQVRIQACHAAQLLSQEELLELEDRIVDAIEADWSRTIDAGARADGFASARASQGCVLAKMVVLSEKVVGDAMFARQLRRKFV
jgi:hypothetical protein